MAFRDVLIFLFERSKTKFGITNQEEFARRHGVERETMNQWLTGNLPVPNKTIWEILEREDYIFSDCIQLPETRTARAEYQPLFDDLETIITIGKKDIIQGIKVNLEYLAEGSRTNRKKKRPKPSNARDRPAASKQRGAS